MSLKVTSLESGLLLSHANLFRGPETASGSEKSPGADGLWCPSSLVVPHVCAGVSVFAWAFFISFEGVRTPGRVSNPTRTCPGDPADRVAGLGGVRCALRTRPSPTGSILI